MMRSLEALKKHFREGRRAEAIADCEAWVREEPSHRDAAKLCATMHSVVGHYPRALELLRGLHASHPRDADVLFNIGACERESGDVSGAARSFRRYTETFPNDADGWASLAECHVQSKAFDEGLRCADRAIKLDARSLQGWTNRAHCQKGLRQFDAAVASYERADRIQATAEGWYNTALCQLESGRLPAAIDALTKAIRLAPALARLRLARGDAHQRVGKIAEAADDYTQALRIEPTDEEALKKATSSLLQAGQGARAIELCREILAADPGHLAARLGAQWVLSQLVPLWHVPMMNETERNQAYHDGLQRVMKPGATVFEIGTGSGLLSMMAARFGARTVHTCEAVPLIAQTAMKIVADNGFADRITVLPKASHAVRLGADLPTRADLLVHEVFSSELLGEAVLPAIEDAKARLLAPGGTVLPSAASLMIALVGGDALGRHLHVDHAFGFDLRAFNAIHPKKVPLNREDLSPDLLSDGIEAFRFDFQQGQHFPAERKSIELTARTGGVCHGIIQWIRVELGEGVLYENHPLQPRAVSNWQHTVFCFDAPVVLEAGTAVAIVAMHDRSRPWFERAAPA
jgi:type II protein arginine methyltransferase